MADKPKKATVRLYSGNDTAFQNACKGANTPPTKRQFKKFSRKEGLAYRYMVENKS